MERLLLIAKWFSKRRNFLLSIFFLTFFVRILFFKDAPIYSDEITWMVRGKETVYSVFKGNLAYFKSAWWTKSDDTEAIGLPLVFLNGPFQIFLAGSSKYSLKLVSDIAASRLPIIIVNSFLPVLIFLFADRYLGKKPAMFSAVLYALNPAIVGVDLWIINDSLLTLFSLAAIYFFFVSRKEKRLSLLPGIFLGLAFLTKPTGILVLVAWFALAFFKKDGLRSLLFGLGVFFVFVSLSWPHSWTNPFYAVFEYLSRQTGLAQEGIANYYFGKVTTNPHWSYYLFLLSTRLTELSVVGLSVSLVLVAVKLTKKAKMKIKPEHAASLLYVLFYLLAISLSAKKLGLRYALPAVPFLIVFSGYGLCRLYEMVKGLYRKALFIVFAAGLAYPLTWLGDAHIYYNTFVGEAKGAQEYVLVGWCSSTKEAFEYLDKKGQVGTVYVPGCPAPTSYYSKFKSILDFGEADYIVSETYHEKQQPDHPLYKYLEGKEPTKYIFQKGVVLAKIYDNR